jgi:hypothetical protein
MTDTSPSQSVRYYLLAHGARALSQPSFSGWPYEISLCFEPTDYPVGFAEGVGHGAVGGNYSAEAALQTQWADYFLHTQGQWLLPFIERFAAGLAVDAQKVLQLYRAKHDKEPYSYLISSTGTC